MYNWCLEGREKVGFVPFARKCVFNKKVQHEVGQKIANEDIKNWMMSMHSWLQLPLTFLVLMVERMLQPFLSLLSFKNLMVRTSKSKNWSSGNELSPLQQFGTSVARVGNARVTLHAQREQLAVDKAKANAVAQNKMSRQSKNTESAQQALVYTKLGGIQH